VKIFNFQYSTLNIQREPPLNIEHWSLGIEHYLMTGKIFCPDGPFILTSFKETQPAVCRLMAVIIDHKKH